MKTPPRILIVLENEKFRDPIKYILDLFFSVLGINYELFLNNEITNSRTINSQLVISYGKRKPKVNTSYHIHIYESDFFGKNYLKQESLPRLPLERYNNLPIIYQRENKIDSYVRNSKDLIETDIDIIASSFFMITRCEEIISKDRDEYDRFPATASLAYKENFLDRPIVNEYIELLWNWINSFNLGFKRKRLWNNKDFAVCLTHDVDEIKRYKFYPPLGAIFRSIRQKNFKKAKTIFFDYLKTKVYLKQDIYYDTFDYITNLEKKCGFRSSFYFMTNDERYSLDNPWFKNLVIKLKKENFETGIHPSFNTCNNSKILRREKEKLEKIIGKKIIGGRQHYLKWAIPESWRVWERIGLRYDTTLGFADREGFRCGICHPFKPFDVKNNKVVNIWEVPLIIMDATLISRKLSPRIGLKKMINLLSVVEKHSGVFVFLWHNSYMTNLFTPEWKECFEDFYSFLLEKDCIILPVKNMLNNWEECDAKRMR